MNRTSIQGQVSGEQQSESVTTSKSIFSYRGRNVRFTRSWTTTVRSNKNFKYAAWIFAVLVGFVTYLLVSS